MSRWIKVHDESARAAALALTRGCYQRALLRGEEALSGSTLRGKAKRYSGRYQASAAGLLSRMTREGIAWDEERADHGRRVLVIGTPRPSNTEGLTFNEWRAAAQAWGGAKVPYVVALRAWAYGEDPTEYAR